MYILVFGILFGIFIIQHLIRYGKGHIIIELKKKERNYVIYGGDSCFKLSMRLNVQFAYKIKQIYQFHTVALLHTSGIRLLNLKVLHHKIRHIHLIRHAQLETRN